MRARVHACASIHVLTIFYKKGIRIVLAFDPHSCGVFGSPGSWLTVSSHKTFFFPGHHCPLGNLTHLNTQQGDGKWTTCHQHLKLWACWGVLVGEELELSPSGCPRWLRKDQAVLRLLVTLPCLGLDGY